MAEKSHEAEQVAARYARRQGKHVDARYSMLNASVWQAVQERQRALISLLKRHAPGPLDDMRVLEIGCGGGGNLLELLRLGCDPRNLQANELLPERVTLARRNLPEAIVVHSGDALKLQLPSASFDVVYQSTVFTSLLDDKFQEDLARQMWEWVSPGGGVLWYDFIYDNPGNQDVRGVPLRRIRNLFPHASIDARRVTLAPPISRRVCKLHPAMYSAANLISFLRTHVICWIGKPA